MKNRIDEQTALARVNFIEIMQSEYPADRGIPELCRLLMRQSTTHRRLKVQCRIRSENPDRNVDGAWCERHIIDLCREFGEGDDEVVPVFNGNPGGATVKLRVPSGATDDFEKIGICVPAGRI